MKKLISLLLVFAMLTGVFAMCGVTAFAEENDITDYITYEIYDGEVTITDCDESISGDVVIPDTIEGYPVAEIGNYAFSGCSSLTSITIPDSVTIIGDSAFSHCKSFENFVVPDSITEIGVCAFQSCENLTSVTIGNNVKTIGNSAFMFCEKLENITISESVVSIGDGFVFQCLNLKSITVDNENQYYSSDEYGVLYNKDKTELIQYPIGNDRKEFIIPDGVVTIGENSFLGSIELESVLIPASTEVVSLQAFATSWNLKSVVFADNSKLRHIGMLAFAQSAIETIDLPASVEIIEMEAFTNCFALESITIPEGIERIEPGAFVACLSLKEVNLPESITYIGNAFDACPCIDTIVVPENTIDIKNAFISTGNLKNIVIYNPDIDLDESNLGYTVVKFDGDYNEYDADVDGIFDAIIENDAELIDRVFSYIVSLENIEKVEDFTIYGYKGSTAEAYADEHGFRFVPICKHNYVDTVITPATYTQTGEGGMVCEHCGDVQNTYEIPMLEIEDSDVVADKKNDVSVYFPEGTFDGDVKIEVTPVEEGEAFKLISHKQGNYKVTMFDINVSVDGDNVQPNGTVLVKIPLPKGYNQNKCVVYYVAADGTMEELKTYHFKDGYVYFETDHFSYYAILENTEEDNNQTSVSFIDKIVIFLKRIVEFFKKLFFEATGRA